MSEPDKKVEPTFVGATPADPNATAPEVTIPAAAANGNATPLVELPSNDNEETEAPAAAATATPGISRKKKILSAVFNMAAGAVVTGTVKAVVVATMTWAAAPAVATLLVSSLAVGVASASFCHLGQVRAAKKNNTIAPKFWSKATAKTAAKSSAFALVGGALFLGFSEGIIQNWLGFGHHVATAPVVPQTVAPVVDQPAVAAPVVAPVVVPVEHIAPAVVAAPVVHCATPVEQFADLIKGHHVSAQVTDAMHRAASSNAHVAAQGAKDMAFYAQNGLGGVPKDAHVAVELFKQAADAGNVQARVDMLYLQHHGLDTITADKQASLSAMKDIAHNSRATHFVKAWGGAGKTLPHVDFNTDTILKGVKLACPKA